MIVLALAVSSLTIALALGLAGISLRISQLKHELPNSADARRLIAVIEALDKKLSPKLEKIMSIEDDLVAAVASETTVEQSVVTLLDRLSAQIAAAGTNEAALQGVLASINSNKAALAAALVRNTPVDPLPAPAEPPVEAPPATSDTPGDNTGAVDAAAPDEAPADPAAASTPTP